MRGSLHTHTMYSINDSAMSINSLLQKAHELGMTSIALTDHGTLLGVDEFLQAEGYDDINKIVGVEVFFSFNENIQSLPKTSTCLQHLVLLAKNNDGYREICNIVTDSNHPDNILKINKKRNYAVVTPSILQRYISGQNVIALTACVQGIVSERLLRNFRNEAKMKNMITEKDFEALTNNMNLGKEKIQTLKKEIASIEDDYGKSKIQNQIEIAEIRQEKIEEEYAKKAEEIQERRLLQAGCKPQEELYKEACGITGWFKNLFGAENFYIELQNHGLPEEQFVAKPLVSIAKMYGIKVVATNDVHILNNSEDDVLARTISKFNGFGTWFEPEQADKELYLKTENELKNALLMIYPLDIVEQALNSIDEISERCHVKLTQEYHYPVFKM